jgi:DNA-binding CsgD family transcriptional regulator
LQLLARGLNGTRIAEQLSISRETVRTHIRNAMEKLHARTRPHAIALAACRGEIDICADD